MVVAFGSVAASQGNQVGFAPIIQLAIPVGSGWSWSAPSNPSSAYCRLVRNTVRGDVCSAVATWDALQPSSVLSRMRARLMTRAECWPFLINPSSWARSYCDSRTANFS